MIEIKSLSKNYKRKVIIDDINLKMDNGVYGLLGPNGAGKTTFMRCLVSLISFNKGKITVNGKNIKNDENYLKEVGYVPQKFGLFEESTVYEVMEYFCVLKGVIKGSISEEIENILKLVNLEDKKNNKIKSLSGGMVRRVGIAQSLINNPKIIIFDEPTVGLDPEERIRFKNIVAKIKENKIIIISTHIVEDVEAICDNIIIMNKGKILSTKSSEDTKNIALGKIYNVNEKELELINGSFEIIKIYEENSNTVYRILTKEKLNAEEVNPTIEDGYLCMIKGV
ncbi:ATP-binding cassette domain-containing protein [Clostridium sp. D53t1_180928_C8]|uniref:ATP-binding cassette domain-containing protein n=1 Tax=Clostridium sp. D53t1_180928_C8 TaxID=2787101 RepID=UPI0018ABBD16|nr:ATP-binding cassette domain-containing protein [Clostridium sp. D53t1_180928_C8]